MRSGFLAFLLALLPALVRSSQGQAREMYFLPNSATLFSWTFIFASFSRAIALQFDAIGGPFSEGEAVSVSWILNGSEPAAGWQLWFVGTGQGLFLENIAPTVVSTVVPFPGFNGTFDAMSGVATLATSAPVTALGTPSIPPTSSQAASSTSSSSRSELQATSSTSSQTLPPANTPGTGLSSSSGNGVATLLGIIVGALAVTAIIVILLVVFHVQRRRRLRAERGVDDYPFAPGLQARSTQASRSARRTSSSRTRTPRRFRPTSASSSSLTSEPSNPTSPSAYSPATPGPRNVTTLVATASPTIEIPMAASRRDAYLSAQISRLESAEYAVDGALDTDDRHNYTVASVGGRFTPSI
ncbi:hypothetical protein HMN09_01386600 [Mycena chlorophos]|uniref:Mid2 domain-containing protein n=1 Tax=Mycena chlorophos TaxID=658473 RepID=A0A8H6RVG9_MYCCL|nr:hypothetical protein HMN09_01386600 [Mycena chlorophos]